MNKEQRAQCSDAMSSLVAAFLARFETMEPDVASTEGEKVIQILVDTGIVADVFSKEHVYYPEG